MTTATALMSMPEIAALAQVQRPVVSNWRRRHPDFPAPVTPSVDLLLFDGQQVVAWLIANGLGNAAPDQLHTELVLHCVTAHADRTDPLRVVETLGALLCLRYLDDKPLAAGTLLARAEKMDPDDEFLLRELRAAGASAPLVTITEDLIEAAFTEGGAYEWLLAARSRLGVVELTSDALAPELRQLIADLADLPARLDRTGAATVADPHAGPGDLLTALIRTAEDPQMVTAQAADPNERLARITRRRLLLAGLDEVSLDVQPGTDLEEDLADLDLVVTQLPYRPGEDRSVLAALEGIERVADMLGPGSTALVLGPADALVDAVAGTEESQLRSALLRSKVVEAVIALPGGMLTYRPGYRLALWILTRSPVPAAEGNVLLADISADHLTESVRRRLTDDVLLWRAEGFRRHDGHDPRYGLAVRVAELDRAFGGPLTPPGQPESQALTRTVTERAALIAETETLLEQSVARSRSYADEHGPYRGNVVRRTSHRPPRTTLGTLIDQGRVTKIKGHRFAPQDLGEAGHYTVLGPDEATGRTAIGTQRIDRLILAARYEHVAFTEPGDLVYTLAPELGLFVDEDGLKVVAFPARVLRVDPEAENPLTPRVLAALLGAAHGTGRSPSAVRAARRIEDYALPDLSADDITRFDAALAEIERREHLLSIQSEALTQTRRLTVAGLADGTLTIDQSYQATHSSTTRK